MAKSLVTLSTMALLIAAGPAVMAQSQTTGSIVGVVRDDNGKPLPGASVRISSSQINKTAITDAGGTFRFPLLNVGEWKVEVSKAGMQTQSAKVTVTSNSNTPTSFNMKSVSTATVEVVASTTAVGVDSTTTTTGKSMNSDIISSLPVGRSSNDIAFLAPGTTNSGWAGNPAIGGGSATENSYVVDGLNTTDMRFGFQGSSLPKEFIEQTEVMTGGYAPEFSALGGVINAVTKQGTNTFSGNVSYIQNMPNAQAYGKYNPDMLQRRPDLPQQWREVVVSVGGAIVPDKFFYFVGVDYTKTDAKASSPNWQGLISQPLEPKDLNPYIKLNWYVATDHQLSATINQRRQEQGWSKSFPNTGNADYSVKQTDNSDTLNLTYDWTITGNMFLSAKYGKTKFAMAQVPGNTHVSINDQNYYVSGPGKGTAPAGFNVYGADGGFRSGGFGGWTAKNDGLSDQLKVDFTYVLNSHYIKAGFSTKNDTFDQAIVQDSVGYRAATIGMYKSGSKKGQFRGIMTNSYQNIGKVERDEQAFYVQDLWEVSPGLKVRYGFRYEGQDVKKNDGSSFLKFKNFGDVWQPRLGFTWDPTGDGSQKITGSYSQYYEAIPMQPAMRAGGTEIYLLKYYSPARSTYNPATGTFAITGAPDGWDGNSAVLDYAGAGAPIADDLKLPKRREVVLGYERLLKNGWKVGANLKWRRLIDPIEDIVPTDREGYNFEQPHGPNEDFGSWYPILCNPKAGQTYTWISALDGQRKSWTNDIYPTAYNDYKSVELTAEKKGDNWYFSGSYTWSRLYGTYEGLASASNGQADANITASFDYWPYVGEGLLPTNRTHMFKGLGMYTLPAFGNEFLFSAIGNIRSGTKETVLTGWDDLDIGGYNGETKLDGKYGGGAQNPWFMQLDLNIAYKHRFNRKVVLTPSFDIFNVFNKRQVTSQMNTKWNRDYPYPGTHPYFGMPDGWQAGRSMNFSLKLEF